MTNEQKALELLNAMGGDISKVIELLSTAKESEEWKPRQGNTFYWIDDNGKIIEDKYVDHRVEHDRIKFGNFFKTREQAERYSKRTSLFLRMHKDAERRNKGKEKNWFIAGNHLYYFIGGDLEVHQRISEYKDLLGIMGLIYYSSQDAEDARKKFLPELEELYGGDE